MATGDYGVTGVRAVRHVVREPSNEHECATTPHPAVAALTAKETTMVMVLRRSQMSATTVAVSVSQSTALPHQEVGWLSGGHDYLGVQGTKVL